VADGGFREFLGAEDLLRRRCRLIVVSDAGCNEGSNEFSAFADLVRLARIEHGIQFLELDEEVPICLERFRRPAEDQPSPQQFLCARIRYPESDVAPREGLLVYLHMALTGKEDVDLQQFRKRHPRFPYESTSNQFFTPKQVESYRQLGYYVGKLVCRNLPRREPSRWQEPMRRMPIDELIYRIQLAYLDECHIENSFDEDDLTTRGLFDLDDSRLGIRFDKLIDEQSPEAALRRYDDDADYRMKWRAIMASIFATGCAPTVPNPDTIVENGAKVPPFPFNLRESAGSMAVALLSANELTSFSKGPHFQVGGRERLVALAKDLSDEIQCVLPVQEMVGHQTLPSIGQFVADNGPIIAEKTRGIFRHAEEATARLFLTAISHEPHVGRLDNVLESNDELQLLAKENRVYAARVND
jgi:hypothetical protein